MIFDKDGKPHLECESCFNNGSICKCSIYSGNPKLPNMYNKTFEPVKTTINLPKKENIYEAKL